MSVDEIRSYVWQAIWLAYGRAPLESEWSYWVDQGKFQECFDYKGLNYAMSRVEGYEASPPSAQYGPYAAKPVAFYGPVPLYGGSQPQAVQNAPSSTIPPAPVGDPYQDVKVALEAIQGALGGIQATLGAIKGAIQPPGPYSGSIFGIKVVLHPGE